MWPHSLCLLLKSFIKINGKDWIHKYFDLQELTSSVLNDMVKRVYVHAPQTIDGKRTQEIDIVYDLVGILPLSLFNNEEGDVN